MQIDRLTIKGIHLLCSASRQRARSNYDIRRSDIVKLLENIEGEYGGVMAGLVFCSFATGGRSGLGGFSKFKHKLDEAGGVTGWTLQDLRRTARSLMSRAGIPSDHAERCLGHVIGGVRGVYDRHEFHAEKMRAYEALAAQIDRIVNPKDNVVPLQSAGGRKSSASIRTYRLDFK